MTDFALKSPDQETMYAAFEAAGILVDGVVQTQGVIPAGNRLAPTGETDPDTGNDVYVAESWGETWWALVDQGLRSYPTGEVDAEGNPIYSTDEYWVALRWNGDAPLPADEPGVEIVWRSDVEEPGPYPEGLTRFA